jgi:hypothetical protein
MKVTKEQFDKVFAEYKADYNAKSAELAKHLIENDPLTFVLVAQGVQCGMVKPTDIRVFAVIYSCLREAGFNAELTPDVLLEVKQAFAGDKQEFMNDEIGYLIDNNPLVFQLVETVPYDALLAVLYLAMARRLHETVSAR